MNYSQLAQLPWIDTPPYDQVLTELVSFAQKREMGFICIQGPNGSGKSRILTELLSSLSFDKTASLIALSGQDNEVFYHNVQISPDLLNLQNSTFLNNFILTLEAILKEKQHFYILIDDVEALPTELMIGMLQIIESSEFFKAQVTLVVFMGMITIPIDMKRWLRNAEMITLTPMSVMQTKQFVDKAYQYLKSDQEISITDVNRLHNLSYGYVGRVINLLECDDNTKTQKVLFKQQNIRLAVLATAVLVMAGGVYSFFSVFTEEKMPNVVKNTEEIPKSVVSMPIVEVPKKTTPIKVILPIQTAAEYDAMNNQIEIKRLVPQLYQEALVTTILAQHQAFSEERKNFVELNTNHTEKMKKTVENAITQQQTSDQETKPSSQISSGYIIELGRKGNRRELESLLSGRSIPGKAQFKLINDNGSKVWVAYIGPYSSKKNAEQGQKHLPASLQRLPLKVNKEF